MVENYNETVKEAKEASGIMKGGARFQQEKRKRTGEGPVAI